ncbi:MAG: homocysteine biosynthesis protein, partial [Patescibacteria group bacterium]|nr:homocysteine biosynthesis protein [Patescibacteria group bacterium]
DGKKVITAPLSSYYKANQIANVLKDWIESGKFLLGEPQQNLPSISQP